jgi:hypothetical protein
MSQEYAIVYAHCKISGIGHVLYIKETTVSIKRGDLFRSGPGYNHTFTIKDLKTHFEDDLEDMIDLEDVGLGMLTISDPRKNIQPDTKIWKVMLTH